VSLINLATGPGFLIYAGTGKLKPGVDAAILGVVVNVVLSFGLIYRYGFAGAVVGTAVSLIVSAMYFTVVFHRQTGYSLFRLLGESYAKPLACSILSLAAVLLADPNKDLSWPGLAGVAVAFGAMYSALILLTQFFDAYDWKKIEGFVPIARHVRRLARFAW